MQCRACGRIAIHAIVLFSFLATFISTRVNTSTRQRQILARFILSFYAIFTTSLGCFALINYFTCFLTDEASAEACIKRLIYRAPVTNNSDEMQESESESFRRELVHSTAVFNCPGDEVSWSTWSVGSGPGFLACGEDWGSGGNLATEELPQIEIYLPRTLRGRPSWYTSLADDWSRPCRPGGRQRARLPCWP